MTRDKKATQEAKRKHIPDQPAGPHPKPTTWTGWCIPPRVRSIRTWHIVWMRMSKQKKNTQTGPRTSAGARSKLFFCAVQGGPQTNLQKPVSALLQCLKDCGAGGGKIQSSCCRRTPPGRQQQHCLETSRWSVVVFLVFGLADFF